MAETPQMLSLPQWPHFSEEEVAAVGEVLSSGRVNYWTGTQGREFEREYAEYVGVDHGIAVSNGTVALEMSLRVLDIQPGDEVVVTPRTFIASASSIVLCGGIPVFADVDRESQTITAETIAPLINERTRAIVLVHLAGWPCEMPPILELANQYNIPLIEDCAQAHGARYRDKPVGSFGDLAAFSFCQDKIMSTGGEGGMLVMRSDELWDKAWSYKDHGKSYAAVSRPPASGESSFRWVHESFGSNFRMTELQAAIGRIQLRKLDDWVERRRSNASILTERLAHLPTLRISTPPSHVYHAYYKFYAFVEPQRLHPSWSRDRIISEINQRGVPCFGGSCSEVYREKAFVDSRLTPESRLQTARELGETSLMFLVHPTLAAEHMHQVADVVEDVLRASQG